MASSAPSADDACAVPGVTPHPRSKNAQYKRDMCQVDDCDRLVQSVAKKSLQWLGAITFISELTDDGRKHHCRSCLRRVCTAHFVTHKDKSKRRCTDCAADEAGAASGGAAAAADGGEGVDKQQSGT